MPDRERLDITIRGGVQGVGFRYFTLRTASSLDLEGWVANAPDGSVHCVAEGPRAALDRLLAALSSGPPGARVDRVEQAWSPATGGLGAFGVRSGSHRGD
ncbi:MAG: acylphosphatase [Chloroflexota bacterium]